MFSPQSIAALTLLLVCVADAKGPFDLSQDPRYSPAPTESGLVEGDFKLTEKQKLNLKLYNNVYGPALRSASGRESERWPGAVIPYVFDCSVTNMANVIWSVKVAMAEWENRTCIRFVERTDQKNYLKFFRGGGCYASYIGYQGVKTRISVGDGCDYKHVMVHELGHVIGFWHEQSRPDRDNYIEIIWDNVIDSKKHNFKKKTGEAVDSVGEPYDYASIMHYPFNAFSKNRSKNTIVPIQPLNGKTPYVELTDSDARQANIMYRCSAVVRQRNEELKRARVVRSANASCFDEHPTCPAWAAHGYCVKAADPLLKTCRKSCNNCGQCVDDNVSCKDRAKNNGCRRNEYMLRHCKVSCKICTPGIPNTPPATNPPATNPPATTTPGTTLPATKNPSPSTQAPVTKPTVNPPTKSKYKGIKCGDADKRCPGWAANGRCKTGQWIKKNCLLSCQRTDICDMEQPRPSGACSEPLGLGWDRTLPDNSFEASTEYVPGGVWAASADNARLYMRDDHSAKRIGAWCSDSRHHDNQWLKIDLGQVKQVSAVATQGRDRYYEHVKSYELSYSVNGSSWQKYKEGSIVKEFTGNCDHLTPVINTLSQPVHARFVRFHPKKYYANMCIRAEIYGCNI